MAHRVRSLTNFLLCVLWLTSCQGMAGGEFPSLNKERLEVRTHRGITTVAGRPFSGTLYQLSASGDTLEIKRYLDGRPHGVCKEWYANGHLREIRPYKNGKAHGETHIWWESGARKAHYQFAEGQYHGSCMEWRPSGGLIKKMNFVQGREEGRQQFWNEQGELWANYDARGGRKYGMTGKKGCATVWEKDSVYVAKK